MTFLAPPAPATRVDMPGPGEWVIEWRGRSWHESQLTGRHAGILAILNGRDDFQDLIPQMEGGDTPAVWRPFITDADPRQGYMRLMSMIVALIAADTEEAGSVSASQAAITQAVAELKDAPLEEIVGALRA